MRRQNSRGSDVFEEEGTGRVQVYVRIRPLVESDVRSLDGKGAVSAENDNLTQVHVMDGKREKIFQFDQVLPPDAENDEVYQVVGKPLVEASMTGLNGILMAYGQTGAGKTHTLMATDGLTTSVVSHMFALIDKDVAHSYAVTCSYLQIYQARVYDLLGSEKSGTEVYLREHPKKGVYVDNLSEYFVKSPEEICKLLKSGKKKLAIAETKMNRHSSRSHAVCLLKIERLSVPRRYGGITDSFSSYESYYISGTSDTEYSSESGSVEGLGSSDHFDEDEEMLSKISSQTYGLAAVRGKLYVCDLAGSERVKKTKAEGERLQEAQSINSSLLELGNVIQALAEGTKRHIPYRNSTLTRLLQDGLDGNSKTSLIVCVSPSFRDVNETLCSLKFGLRAMKVRNVAQVNVEIDYEKMAKQLSETLESKEREWRRLKAEYESYIMSLEAERETRQRREPRQQVTSECHDLTEKALFPAIVEEEALRNQTKAVLLAELVSLELFYGLEDLVRDGSAGKAQGVTSSKLHSLTDKDLLLHSAETLLELTEYFFTKSTLAIDENGKNSKGATCETEKTVLPSISLELDYGSRHSTPNIDSSYERKLLRVRESLSKLKRKTDSAALGFLSHLLDTKLDEKEKGLQEYRRRLFELLKHLLKSQDSALDGDGTPVDPLKLEQSLCHVLMDKAILNCLLLLDKADMESRIRSLAQQQTRFDYSGTQSGEGRLTSVDEGVVLESLSDSANSREKLSVHLENTMEELEAENGRLYEKNEELRKRYEQIEGEKSKLTLKILDYEEKLQRCEKKLKHLMQSETNAENDLRSKIEEKDFETNELLVRVDELEDQLQFREQKMEFLRETERKLRVQLSEERKRSDDAEERSAKLQLKIQQLEDKCEQCELKLASFTGSDLLESNKITKQLENSIAENKALSLRVFQLEDRLNESGGIVSPRTSDENESDNDQKKILEKKVIELEVKVKEQQVKILSVKEYERRLRAELCKEMTKKLTKAQTRSRELGEKIFELETKLRQAEQQYSTVKDMDMNVRSAMRGDIKILTEKLENAEARNKDVEDRLHLSQREVLLTKQTELDLRERAQTLEVENCKFQERLLSRKEEKMARSSTGRTADRLEKLRKENSNLSLELKSFRENTLKLERDLLERDHEILKLRNESVDLSSEVCKLRTELDDSERDKAQQERSLRRYVESEEKLLAKLSVFQQEVERLRASETGSRNENETPTEIDSKSDTTASTLVIGEEHPEIIETTHMKTDTLLREQTDLQTTIDDLQHENSKMAKENERLIQEIKTLEANLSIVEKTFRVCRSDNECLLHEMNLKSAEATTLRTYAAFCSEKAKEMRSEIAAHKQNEAALEKRLTDLERESAFMRNEVGHGILDFTELREKKISLEKRIIEASRTVDHLKQEVLGLINGMLTLQRDLNIPVDKIIGFLGLDEETVQRYRLRPTSIDSNDTSTRTEESSSEIGSDINELFSLKSLFTFRLLPDKEGFLNPSDVSIMRENKTEILRSHEELKAKVHAIRDSLGRKYELSNFTTDGKLEIERSHEVRSQLAGDPSTENSNNDTTLPRLSRAERVKLSSLLSRLKEELVRERNLNNEGRIGADDDDICLLYDNLECKLSRLSCELVSKEDEIAHLLTERSDLQNELEECENGLSVCHHCALKVPTELDDNREQLKGKLLSQMQDTSRLEGEIFEFMEYRQKLEKELDSIKGKITDVEDELDVRKILIERCISSRPLVDEMDVTNSYSSKEEIDDLKLSSSGKKRKSQKHVTFENVDNESEGNSSGKRRREKPHLLIGQDNEEPNARKEEWRTVDLDSSELDLCELLASIPMDIPKKQPTEQELEITEIANRLSGYDNMSFDEKFQFVSSRREKSDADSTTSANGDNSSFNGVGSVGKDTVDEVCVDYSEDAHITCQLCGLFKKGR
ncbi:kinesin-like protein KIF15 isoform X2 [Stylophora pistillata]|uniref:kinesin-like protein KIF15 isoform X2 n=1 Tax=Stylophora pistillata TaxID=50429 RepID=UPI000C046EA8|nr:kinesin-like protein KIF15 isoform X2 [Stylophora pistillata]